MRSRCLLLCILLPLFSFGQQRMAVQKLLNTPGLKTAAIGISVKRIADGKVIAEYNPVMALTPASVVKLITTAFVLKEKGADYTYSTDVFYSGKIENTTLSGDVIIQAVGDPCFDSRYFPQYKLMAELVAAIEKAGIKKINGTILVSAPEKTFEEPSVWLWEDISNYYGAQWKTFNYRDNTYTLELSSGKAGTRTKLLSVLPELPETKFENEVTATVGNSDNAWIFGGQYCPVLQIRGTIPQHRTSFKIKGAIHNPAACFTNEIVGKLKEKGISIGNLSLKNTTTTKLLTFKSPAIKKIVYHTNKVSVNLFAEALGKLIAKADYQTKIQTLFQEIGIDPIGIILKDACGLSPLNAVPAAVFTDLLIWADRNLNENFTSSLPIAGIDAGLNGYCADAPALKNNLKAKTGTISGTRCLSGYLTNQAGEKWAFTIMINHYTCTASQLQKAVGTFLAEISGAQNR